MVERLNPRDWRDIQVLRAQGVLAETLTVGIDDADRGLRALAELTGTPLHQVAQQVIYRELTLARELCVPDGRVGSGGERPPPGTCRAERPRDRGRDRARRGGGR